MQYVYESVLRRLNQSSKPSFFIDHRSSFFLSLTMRFFIFLILLINLLLARYLFDDILPPFAKASSYMQPLCHDYERTALLSFKASFITLKSASHNPFAYPKLASWNTNGENAIGNCCSWDGVECDQNTGHVIGLDLSSSYLYGSINSTSQLFNLSQLQSLNLADNDFNFSYIPTRIGQLSRLVYLNLSASMFSGQIPFEISQLSNLLYLDLSLSSGEEKLLELKKPGLRGLVHNLTSLQHLDLSYIEINSVVPESLGNLSSLRYIDLTRCGMHGNFPNKIFELPNLEFLNVRFNGNLSGNLPEFHSGSPLKSLRLGNTRFFGGLPSSISNLDSLTELRIRGCNFSGSIPSSIGNLTKLTYLDLANNSWHGQIPSSLQNLTQLSYLQLSYNAFSGQILPTLSWIGKLSKLILLDLTKTNLTGSIPSSFSNLTQLSNFRLAYNHLTGQVPLWLMNFTQLTDLYLSQNFLTGTLQLETFINHASLTILRLSHNQLTLVSKTNSNTTLGKLEVLELASCNLNRLPDFLNFRNKLEWLDLSENNLHGTIPKLESTWSNIEVIDLSSNKLGGSLPIPPPTLTSYLVSNNTLSGEISPSICQLNSLYALDLSYNNFSGQLPSCLGNSSDSLTVLKLQNNNFHGPILPTCTEENGLLKLIDLSYNRFQGQVPRSLANCRELEYLNVGNNLIGDTFPFWLATLPELKVLMLSFNEFYGAVWNVETDHSFPKLRIIDLSHNHFSGGLPLKYFQYFNAMKVVYSSSKLKYMQLNQSFDLQAYKINRNFGYSVTLTNKGIKMTYTKIQELLTAIDFSSNEFEGEIPELLGNLKGLSLLNLSNNKLVGGIPASLGSIEELETLDLSRNKLSGEIPQQLTKLNFLSFFNVSHNHLTGSIPQGGQFDTFENSSFSDNFGLYKKHVNTEASSPPSRAVDNGESSENGVELDWKAVLMGYGSGVVFGGVIGYIVIQKKLDWFLDAFRIRRRVM